MTERNMTFVQMASRIELQQLQYFVTVAEQLNFSKAAEVLFVTQPLLSQQISSLESTLGVKLFHRSTKAVALTPAGEVILVQARRILEKTREAMQAARTAAREASSEVRVQILCDFVFEKNVLSEKLDRRQEKHPNWICEIKILPYPTIVSMVGNREADLGLLMVPDGVALPPELRWRELARDTLDLIARKASGGAQNLAAILAGGLPLLLFECDSRLLGLIQQCCKALRITPPILFFQTMEDMMVNVELGEGIAILPHRMAQHYQNRPVDCHSLSACPLPALRYLACWSQAKPAGQGAELVRELWGDDPLEG